jgi:3-phosphoshikimate 1-carboxyvinyltransferase
MASLSVKPLDKIKAEITVPGDKSISHRAIMLGALAKGQTAIENFLASADCLSTLKCFEQLGIKNQHSDKQVIIYGKGLNGLSSSQDVLDVGNSGTTIRLMSGVLAGQAFTSRISGDKSIQKRPMLRVVGPLREMGAKIEGKAKDEDVYAPLTISGGNLSPIHYELPVASAQVKSAVLLAGLYAKGDTAVIEKNRARDHTERMLSHFGADVQIHDLTSRVRGQREFRAAEVDIPGDISSAAFFIVAGLLVPDSQLLIRGVGTNPTRIGIIEVLHRMGAGLEVKDEVLISEEPRANILAKGSKLKAVKIGGEIIPRIIDEIPIIAVAATQAEGITEIRGARELRVKESDRLATISSELKKMGAKVQELEDGLTIEGPTKLKGAKVKSYGDHRIAMALAIAGLIANGETVISDTDCIETSFPGFEDLLIAINK